MFFYYDLDNNKIIIDGVAYDGPEGEEDMAIALRQLYDDIYSSIVRPALEFFFVTQKCSAQSPNVKKPLIASAQSNGDDQDYRNTKWMLREEVEMVMKRLGLSCNPSCEKKDKFSYNEIANMFNVDEPSLGEVQQAFVLFDENHDGFIDEAELDSVLKRLGLREFSRTECQRMISIYDRNGDGLIDFLEFCKLVEDSFC
ncbi:putative calcium-binding protein CML46 [Apium graveolens]|uniref:putative calcium-binding protein CML46 n=1 Tax=Apium graveolens TaxID=4045 RepID=UPI003D7BF358